jgi:hypothetical protein
MGCRIKFSPTLTIGGSNKVFESSPEDDRITAAHAKIEQERKRQARLSADRTGCVSKICN